MPVETANKSATHTSGTKARTLEQKQPKGLTNEVQVNQAPFFSDAGKKGAFFQPKLQVNSINDPREAEADRVAEEVTQSLATGKEGGFFPPSGPDSNNADTVNRKGSFFQRKPAFESPSELDQNSAHADMVFTKRYPNIVQRKPAFQSDVDMEQSKNNQEIQRTAQSVSTALPPPPVHRREDDISGEEIIKNKIQRDSEKSAGLNQTNKGFEARLHQSKGSGAPLKAGTRKNMESAFGADFSAVRIHTDSNAHSMNDEVMAKAFTHGSDIYFNKSNYNPDSKDGSKLLAHELTHVVQQGGTRKNTVQRKAKVNVTQSAPPMVQRGIIDRARRWAAGKAANIPGYTLLSVVIGYDIIAGESVTRNAANILRGIMGILPGGEQIYQALNNHGIFTKVGNWVQQQLDTLGDIAGSLKDAFWEFLDSLGLSDLANPGGAWRRLKRIFSSPVNKIKTFVKSLAKDIIQFIKDAILRPLADLASQTPAWDLLIAVLGTNPITGDAVTRDAETLIGGFMKLIGQEEIWSNIQKANAIPRAWAWFQSTLAGVIALVSSIPSRFINVLKSLTITDIVLVPRAFIKVGKVFLQFAIDFASWAGNAVWTLLEIIFEVVAPEVIPYIKKSVGTFKSILANPMGFVGNLVAAGKLGFNIFKENFLSILREVLLDWLTGTLSGAGIYIPQSFDFFEILKFILSILGLTWENIRAKLVEHLGEGPVVVLEEGFELIKILVTEGPAAAWEKIMEHLTNLKDMVISEILSWVTETVVKKAIVKIVAMFVPGGGFITAIVAMYDTVMVFIQRLQKIIQVARAFMDSVTQIASGNIQPAAEKIVSTLKGLLVLAVSFLAGFVGLGKIGDALQKILKKIRGPIDKALDKVILWIKKKAKSFLKGKDDEKHKQIAESASNDLKKGPSEFSSYEDLRTAKITLSQQIEQNYQGQLKQGIKIKFHFFPPANDKKDEDLDYKITIAPNNTNKKDAIPTSGIVLPAEFKVGNEFEFKWDGNWRNVLLDTIDKKKEFLMFKLKSGATSDKRGNTFKNLTDDFKGAQTMIKLPGPVPAQRYLPAGTNVRSTFYSAGWSGARSSVLSSDKPSLISEVKKVKKSKDTDEWDALKAAGKILLSANINNYDPNPVKYEVDHKDDLTKRWNTGGTSGKTAGHNTNDSDRSFQLTELKNLRLVTKEFNNSRSKGRYQKWVGPDFTSAKESNGKLNGKPFTDAAGNPL